MTDLTPGQLAVLRLTCGELLEYKLAAERLGVTEEAIRAQVRRAYARLELSGLPTLDAKRAVCLRYGWGWPPDPTRVAA